MARSKPNTQIGARPRETLYQLQSRWDDERTAGAARAAIGELRARMRSDSRWLPLALLVGALLAIAFAALTP